MFICFHAYGVEYHSAFGQDRWIVEKVFNRKRGGFFVDLAASDGEWDNNTLTLEESFQWKGICIEANPIWFQQLKKRRNCILIPHCIDGEQHTVEFRKWGHVGGIIAEDTHYRISHIELEEAYQRGDVINLTTKTLEEVLDECNAPSIIDYLSLDVEGAETRILRHFPFDRYVFLAATIERVSPELHQILIENNYLFVKHAGNDDFYIHKSLPDYKNAFDQRRNKGTRHHEKQ